MNFVAIMYTSEEYSRYDHLAPQCSKVKVGQAVSEGQEIAKVGMTGYTFHPHLHFQVFIFARTNVWINFDTVSVQDFISKLLYISESTRFYFLFFTTSFTTNEAIKKAKAVYSILFCSLK
jgi:murein DD-endopeptidase MepM/ murein hydrolase activator NlpD